MEGGGFGFPFGGDPDDLMRGLREFAEQQAESVQEAQREQFATLTLNTAVELTAAALQQVNSTGSPDEQALALRDAMRVLSRLNAEGKMATIDVLGEEIARADEAGAIAAAYRETFDALDRSRL